MNISQLLEFFKGKERKGLLLILVSALVVIVYLFILLPPQLKILSSLSREIRALEDDIASTEADIGKLSSYKSALEENRIKYGSYQAIALTHEQEIPALLEMLSGMARDAGVKIVGIKPLRGRDSFVDVAGSIYKEVPVQISAKSGYHELGMFLSLVEKSKKNINLKNISIEANRSSVKKHDVEILLVAYLVTGEG